MRTVFALSLGLWASLAAVACTVTNIEQIADPVDASFLDVVVPDSALPDVPAIVVPSADSGATDAATIPDTAPPQDATTHDAAPPDAGIDCGALPVLRPPLDASIFCPFSTPFGQPALRCAPTDECCETPADAGTFSTCVAKGSACPVPASTRWECQDTSNCGAGQVCCAVGADGGAFGVLPVGVCGWPQVTSFDGTRCASSCPSGATRVCESQAACNAGTTCTPLRTRGVELGLCL